MNQQPEGGGWTVTPDPSRTRCPLVLLRRLLWIFCLLTPQSGSTLPLPLIAVFPQEGDPRGGSALARALRKAVSDSDHGLFEKDVTLLATPFFSPKASQPFLVNLCNALKRQQPPPAALISFVGPPLSFYVSLLGSHMKIPVIGMSRTYEDRPAKAARHHLTHGPGVADHWLKKEGSFWVPSVPNEMRVRYRSRQDDSLRVMLVLLHISFTAAPLQVKKRLCDASRKINFSLRAD
ncbi:uncharacterized protein TNCV_3377511 [Trichonephila clavipes]|nr:uncharacterized protein TNCV_3377511 [Trichonephila clavipes]